MLAIMRTAGKMLLIQSVKPQAILFGITNTPSVSDKEWQCLNRINICSEDEK
ncbi:hypothetical protein [Streptococcus equi]|uniref:hypothetical protein n=1 Tax=Streptococcus equi TaxID=1336 RepID=UPI002658B1B7|nr:hypothetical protein [Streptococcus equi]WKF66071.1 hypothetical protein QYM01_07515 [Streptococcus equi subsp. zooepidemicus]